MDECDLLDQHRLLAMALGLEPTAHLCESVHGDTLLQRRLAEEEGGGHGFGSYSPRLEDRHRLLELPAGERWSQIATDGGLRRPEVVDLLLEAGRCIDSAHGDDEEVPLLALHLLERLDPEAQPDSLVGDLHCRALALRTEHLIRQRRRRAAEVAALRGRELLLESTDPLVALETGLAVALLGWAKGRGGCAFELLRDLGRLASVLGDLENAAEMALWCHLLLEELGDPDLAAYLKEWAQRLLTAPLAEGHLKAVRAKHAWLRLGEAAPTWEEKRESSRAAN